MRKNHKLSTKIVSDKLEGNSCTMNTPHKFIFLQLLIVEDYEWQYVQITLKGVK